MATCYPPSSPILIDVDELNKVIKSKRKKDYCLCGWSNNSFIIWLSPTYGVCVDCNKVHRREELVVPTKTYTLK